MPSASLIVREHKGRVFWEAKFRVDGRQVMRRVGPAWLERDSATSDWRPRRGRIPEGFYDVRSAHVAAAQLVADYAREQAESDRIERERRTRGVTFREVAGAYLTWLRDVAGAKPATLRNHESVLAEPGVAYRRGTGVTAGHVMAALGDRPAAAITTRQVEDLLSTVSATGASARTVNKYRAVICAAFNHGCKGSTFSLPANPAREADKRREALPGALDYYAPEEVEAIAVAAESGTWREARPLTWQRDEATIAAEGAENEQLADFVRVAAYAGLRLGELLALRWRDVDFAGSALTVARAMSESVESSTKSGHTRRVPLADQAAAALKRQHRREHFTTRDELVFCNDFGRPLDGSALRRRFRAAQKAAGVRQLRLHDLRHSFGSRLAASGVDVVSIKDMMGHAALATTIRYLHARPAAEQARVLTAAFSESVGPDADRATAALPAR